MLVILKMRNAQPGEPIVEVDESAPPIAPEIDGWLIAGDVHDARRQAQDPRLQQWLYTMDSARPGRYELQAGWVGEARYIMLVS